MLLNQAIFVAAVAAWIAVFGVILIVFIRTIQADGLGVAMRRIFSERLVVLLLLVAIVITLVTSSIVFIQPQEVGVVSSVIAPRGYREQPLDSGLHLIIPIVEQTYRFPTYLQTYTISTVPGELPPGTAGTIAARTSDGQAVYVEVSMIYSIDPAQVIKIYLDWQDRYLGDFISPLVQGIVRAKVSQFTVDEVNSDRRQELENQIGQALASEMASYGFTFRRFLLRNITFSPEFAEAVEQKQVAFQGVTRDQYRAQQINILSQAQAGALERLGAALALNPDVLTLSYIEKLAPSITTLLVPNNVPFLLPLPTAFSRAGAVPSVTVSPTPIGQAPLFDTPIPIFPSPPPVGTPELPATPEIVGTPEPAATPEVPPTTQP